MEVLFNETSASCVRTGVLASSLSIVDFKGQSILPATTLSLSITTTVLSIKVMTGSSTRRYFYMT